MTKNEFEDIYRQHFAKMYRLARTMLYDADESKDVVSDSMQERVEKHFLQESMQSQIVSMNDDDRLERLMQFIEAELPPLSQQIFRLRFLSEMSYEEVAQAAGVSKVTVYNHLSQSLQRIREYFEQQTAKR